MQESVLKHKKLTFQKFGANTSVLGAMTYRAGALWPYRFVASVWRDLLDHHPSLSVETSTPVLVVHVSESRDEVTEAYPYFVLTDRGAIKARHVVHATNGHVAQLVPGLRGKLAGTVGHMSAQRPGARLAGADGSRSWSIIYGRGFDYVTQRPVGPDGRAGDLMLGGGWASSPGQGVDMLGKYDDATTDALTAAHLLGIFPAVFGPDWGDTTASCDASLSDDTTPSSPADSATPSKPHGNNSIPCIWTGVLGIPADYRPFVGRLDESTTDRPLPSWAKNPAPGVARPEVPAGEWISAGYMGDGMVWAWLCGTAVGDMLCGRDVAWLPPELRADKERVRKANMTDLLDEVT